MAYERKSADPQSVTTMKALGSTIDRATQVRDLVAAGGRIGRADIDIAITTAGAKVYELAEVAMRNVVVRTGRNASFDSVRAEVEAMLEDWVGKMRAEAGLHSEPLCGLDEP